MKFIQISDLHLTRPGEKVWGLDPLERFDRCIEDIVRHHSDARFCVLTGDLGETGTKEAYEALQDRLRRLPFKSFVMVGNHDDRENFNAVFGTAHCDESGFVQSACAIEGRYFLFLDTLKGGATSAGSYCETRRAWLKGRLAEAEDKPVFLFMHHPPFDIGHDLMDLIKLEDAEGFHRLISAHNVRHLFFGHAHRPVSGVWRGIPFAAPPSLNHQLPLVGGAVATVYSDEPAMYAVVMAEADRTIVHMDAFLDRKPARMSEEQERGNWH
jgi:Icc protein